MKLESTIKVLIFFSVCVICTAFWWLYAADTYKRNFINQLVSYVDSENIKVEYSKVSVTGFPLYFNVKVHGLKIRFNLDENSNRPFLQNKTRVNLEFIHEINFEHNIFHSNIDIKIRKKPLYSALDKGKILNITVIDDFSEEYYTLDANSLNFEAFLNNLPKNSGNLDWLMDQNAVDKFTLDVFDFSLNKVDGKEVSKLLSFKKANMRVLKNDDSEENNFNVTSKIDNGFIYKHNEPKFDKLDKSELLNDIFYLFSSENFSLNTEFDILYNYDSNHLLKYDIYKFDYESENQNFKLNGKLSTNQEEKLVSYISDLRIKYTPLRNLGSKNSYYKYVLYNKFFPDVEFGSEQIGKIFPEMLKEFGSIDLSLCFKYQNLHSTKNLLINNISIKNRNMSLTLSNTKYINSTKELLLGELVITGFNNILENIKKYFKNNQEYFKFDLRNFNIKVNRLFKKIVSERQIDNDWFLIVINTKNDKFHLGELSIDEVKMNLTKDFITQ